MLNGSWLPTRAKLNGQELTAESLRDMRLRPADESYTATVNLRTRIELLRSITDD